MLEGDGEHERREQLGGALVVRTNWTGALRVSLPTLQSVIRWVVKGRYTFTNGGPPIDAVDRIAGGEVRHLSGARHDVGSGPWKTELEWGFETVEQARTAVLALGAVPVVSGIHARALDRVLKPAEFQISHSAAGAGRARCAHCGTRVEMDHANAFALEGAGVGSEVLLRCVACDFVMGVADRRRVRCSDEPEKPGRLVGDAPPKGRASPSRGRARGGHRSRLPDPQG